MKTFEEISEFRWKTINDLVLEHENLNKFHDVIYGYIISAAISRLTLRHGKPPSPFCFFVMGSAGRLEQSIWSDQDHGIAFEDDSKHHLTYFLHLGSEISAGLEQAGYKKCSGDVMASNPLWCKSRAEWQQQVQHWTSTISWESIRHLLILADARPVFGESSLLHLIKENTANSVKSEKLLTRMLENTMHSKKGIGVLGQLLVETHGPFSGCINIKETAILPFVNAARLLSFYCGIESTDTRTRISSVPDSIIAPQEKKYYIENFNALLSFRLAHALQTDYESGHFIRVEHLSKEDKKELKQILKAGKELHDKTSRLIERRIQ
ncbi:hypothetical protein EJA10_14825 [Mesobacillus subterraneus]|uniref:CBS domain-containing protein n=2 Tax=Mesobacillus subterraneus TaxID=285983 RepID=A0A427TPX1_9BACI|nr:hypothetical protein EJA10_14825 [Mesobacillus subterraneus]